MVLSGNQNSKHFSGKLVSFWGASPFRPSPGFCPWAPLGDPLLFAPAPGQIPSYATGQCHHMLWPEYLKEINVAKYYGPKMCCI